MGVLDEISIPVWDVLPDNEHRNLEELPRELDLVDKGAVVAP